VSSALAALTQVLALDIRAVHHGRGGAPSTTRGGAALKRRMWGAERADDALPEPEPGVQYYELWFDVFDLRFTIRELRADGVGADAAGARWFVTVTHVGVDTPKDDASAADATAFARGGLDSPTAQELGSWAEDGPPEEGDGDDAGGGGDAGEDGAPAIVGNDAAAEGVSVSI
jgi:hypothetical protein